MSIEEYFGDWFCCIPNNLNLILNRLSSLNKMYRITPSLAKVFDIFTTCKRKDCRVIILSDFIDLYVHSEVLHIRRALTRDSKNIHYQLWKSFIESFIYNIVSLQTGIVFLIIGIESCSFKRFINKNQNIIECSLDEWLYNRELVLNKVNKKLIYLNGSGL